MSKYECPNCDGGFPEPGQEKECPWCGQSLDKSYSMTPGFQPEDSSIEDYDPRSGIDTKPRNGTTPCPDCGDEMPLVTWTGQKPKCRSCARKDRTNVGDIQ